MKWRGGGLQGGVGVWVGGWYTLLSRLPISCWLCADRRNEFICCLSVSSCTHKHHAVRTTDEVHTRIAHTTTCNLTKPPTPHMHEHTHAHVCACVCSCICGVTHTDTIPFHKYITIISEQHTEKNKWLPHCDWVNLLTRSVTKSFAVLKVSTRQIPGAGTEVQEDSNMYLPQVGYGQTIGFWHPVYCMGHIWVIWLLKDVIT